MYISMFGRGFPGLFDGNWLDAWKTDCSLTCVHFQEHPTKIRYLISSDVTFLLMVLCDSLHECITSINVMLSFINRGFYILWYLFHLLSWYISYGMRPRFSWVYIIVSQQAFSGLVGIIPDQFAIFFRGNHGFHFLRYSFGLHSSLFIILNSIYDLYTMTSLF